MYTGHTDCVLLLWELWSSFLLFDIHLTPFHEFYWLTVSVYQHFLCFLLHLFLPALHTDAILQEYLNNCRWLVIRVTLLGTCAWPCPCSCSSGFTHFHLPPALCQPSQFYPYPLTTSWGQTDLFHRKLFHVVLLL